MHIYPLSYFARQRKMKMISVTLFPGRPRHVLMGNRKKRILSGMMCNNHRVPTYTLEWKTESTRERNFRSWVYAFLTAVAELLAQGVRTVTFKLAYFQFTISHLSKCLQDLLFLYHWMQNPPIVTCWLINGRSNESSLRWGLLPVKQIIEPKGFFDNTDGLPFCQKEFA